MKLDTPEMVARRSYDSSSRDRAAQERKDRCVAIFADMLDEGWYPDITLESVAEQAGVTVPTLLRYFGSKEGLLQSATELRAAQHSDERTAPPGNVPAIVAAVVSSYERFGDYGLRMLAQEDRIPVVRIHTDAGRQQHRQMLASGFAPFLDGLSPAEHTHMLDELVTALDLYVWKVLRRDRKRSAADVRQFMEMAVNAVIARRSPKGVPAGDMS